VADAARWRGTGTPSLRCDDLDCLVLGVVVAQTRPFAQDSFPAERDGHI
jgi:hypothetical protein